MNHHFEWINLVPVIDHNSWDLIYNFKTEFFILIRWRDGLIFIYIGEHG